MPCARLLHSLLWKHVVCWCLLGLEGTGVTGVQLKAFLTVCASPGRDHSLDGSEAQRSSFWGRDTGSIRHQYSLGSFLVHLMCITSVFQSYRSKVNAGASHRGQQTGNKPQFRVHIFSRIAIIMVFIILAFYFSPRTERQP